MITWVQGAPSTAQGTPELTSVSTSASSTSTSLVANGASANSLSKEDSALYKSLLERYID